MLRRVLYLVGALVVLLPAYVPDAGAEFRPWPFDLLREPLAWDSARAHATTTLLFAGTSLLLACLAASKGRGVAALVLAGVSLPLGGGDSPLPAVAAAATAGGILAIRAGSTDAGTRWILAAGLAVLATLVLLPASEDGGIPVLRLSGGPFTAQNLVLEAEVLLLACGLLVLLGVRGRWACAAALTFLGLFALSLPVRALFESPPSWAPDSLGAAAQALAAGRAAVCAWVVAGLIDARTAAPLVR